jgi:peptidoglycan/xylan/chitin deacetylase (PgdA/CDA1 family)
VTPLPELIAGAAALAGAASAGVYHATYSVRSQWLGSSFWQGRTDRAEVALTFDDGPSDDTGRVLDALAARSVHATFFVVGRFAERRAALLRRIAADGHEIGNHSYSHPIYLYRSPRETFREVERTQQIVADAIGVAPVLARPPCGVRTPAYFRACRAFALRSVQWTVAGFDWKPDWPPARIAGAVLAGCAPGAIVLLHDGDGFGADHRRNTVTALGPILDGLLAKNLRVAPLRRLLELGETRSHAPQKAADA